MHLYGSIYLGGMDKAAGVEGTGDALHNVYKNLISPATICPRSVEHRFDDSCRTLPNRERETDLVLLRPSKKIWLTFKVLQAAC